MTMDEIEPARPNSNMMMSPKRPTDISDSPSHGEPSPDDTVQEESKIQHVSCSNITGHEMLTAPTHAKRDQMVNVIDALNQL